MVLLVAQRGGSGAVVPAPVRVSLEVTLADKCLLDFLTRPGSRCSRAKRCRPERGRRLLLRALVLRTVEAFCAGVAAVAGFPAAVVAVVWVAGFFAAGVVVAGVVAPVDFWRTGFFAVSGLEVWAACKEGADKQVPVSSTTRRPPVL